MLDFNLHQILHLGFQNYLSVMRDQILNLGNQTGSISHLPESQRDMKNMRKLRTDKER